MNSCCCACPCSPVADSGFSIAPASSAPFAAHPHSASYASSGASPQDQPTATSPASAASPSSASVSSAHEHDPEFGLRFPDGSRPDMNSYLDANECWRDIVDAVRPRGASEASRDLHSSRASLTVCFGFGLRPFAGPDASNSLIRHVQVKPKQPHFEMRFHASILHMRGKEVTVQPFTAPNGDVLLWNGEIFDGVEVSSLHFTRWCRVSADQPSTTGRPERERRRKALRGPAPRRPFQLLRRHPQRRRTLRLHLLPSTEPPRLLCARPAGSTLVAHASTDAHIAELVPH